MTDLGVRPGTVIGCCILLVLAGCAGVAGPETTPPGVSADNVTDTTPLVEAHTETLLSKSFTVHTTTVQQPVDGNYSIRTNRTWKIAPGDQLRGLLTVTLSTTGDAPARVTGQPDGFVSYREGNVTYRRIQNGSQVEYERRALLNTSVRLNPALQRRLVSRLSKRNTSTVRPVTQDGRQYYNITATLNDSQLVQNASIQVLVTPDGVVRRIHYSQVINFVSGKRLIEQTVRITNIGNTTVERPDWYTEAVEETDTSS